MFTYGCLPTDVYLRLFTYGGSFIVPKRGGLQFVITQSSYDVQVLNYIQTSLGFGKVIQQSKSNKTHWFIVQALP